MQLEQRVEQSETLLETNERNKRRVEETQRQVQNAQSRATVAMARQQQAQAQLQQALAARSAAQQRASQEEGGGYVDSSYDNLVYEAQAAQRAATREYYEAEREVLLAAKEYNMATDSLQQSSQELHNAASELQQISQKYGVEMGKVQELMGTPQGHLASSLMERLGFGRAHIDDLRRRIAASLGISMAGSSDFYGSSDEGYSVRARVRSLSGNNTLYYSGGSGGGGGGGYAYFSTPSANSSSASATPASTSNSGYVSPYKKTSYSQPVTYTHPQTKERITKMSNRTVYENRNLDPNMVIPAGTRRSNGTKVKRATTNIELMRAGKAPFIPQKMADGTVCLAQVELHHLSGEETQHGSQYFRGESIDGTMVEISHITHDRYNRALHMGTPSFRRGKRKEKTEDGVKYDSFRKSYWRNRAAKFDSENSM